MTARLVIGGSEHGGWTRIQIVRGLEQLAGVFTLAVTDRDPGTGAQRAFIPGDPCTVSIDGETVITGYVDAVRVSYDSSSHTIELQGRDATGDLVDCSAAVDRSEWLDTGLADIASEICEPFGVSVNVSGDAGAPFKKFRIEIGESVYEAIERLCRLRGVLAWSDGQGGLEIGNPRKARQGRLRLGANILSAQGEANHLDRYHEYTILAQQPGSDDSEAEQTAHIETKAQDTGIRRHRPLIVVAEQGIDSEEAQKRADWEASVRAARSRQIGVTVQGWTVDGALWQFGNLVRITDGYIGIDGELLISRVTYQLSASGTTTHLQLAPPEAFQPTLAEPDEPVAEVGGPERNWWTDRGPPS